MSTRLNMQYKIMEENEVKSPKYKLERTDKQRHNNTRNFIKEDAIY